MKPTVIIGAQWGDEGKGKLVDAMAADFDVVGRFNGGNNAGHTVIYKGETVKLHILPSGVFARKKLLIAQGAVFDPQVMLTEIEFCKTHNIKLDLLIDYRVNLVMPYHKLMDGASEAWKGKKATGSVKVGIGFCYEDRNNRAGIRVEDLLYPKILLEKLKTIVPLKKAILEKAYGVKADLSAIVMQRDLLQFAKVIQPYIGDVSEYARKAVDKKKMLFEGAMAVMLDGQFGTYPYTVANSTLPNSLFTSLGIIETPLDVIGVLKAYTTRVGGGPFPTEQKNKIGIKLQTEGHEIAATSGRIRRCGWLDLPVIRFAHRLSNFSSLALIKLDVMSAFANIPICVAYELRGKHIDVYPAISHEFYRCRPLYKTLPGWQTPISDVRRFKDLPPNAQKYVEFVETHLGIPIHYISVGPAREQLIKR